MNGRNIRGLIVSLLIVLFLSTPSWAWSCKTHIFIAQEAGIKDPQTACFPDFSKYENLDLLGPLHWHDAAPNTRVTPDYIDQYQIAEKYVKVSGESKPLKIIVPDPAGVLYWEILELYQRMRGTSGVEYAYYLSSIAHYVGDLSQPLHNFPYGNEPAADGRRYPKIGAWAKEHHEEFDDILDPILPLNGKRLIHFRAMMIPVQVKSTDDLKREISKIANSSISLANKCYAENRVITREEALRQIARSVALLRAISEDTQK